MQLEAPLRSQLADRVAEGQAWEATAELLLKGEGGAPSQAATRTQARTLRIRDMGRRRKRVLNVWFLSHRLGVRECDLPFEGY